MTDEAWDPKEWDLWTTYLNDGDERHHAVFEGLVGRYADVAAACGYWEAACLGEAWVAEVAPKLPEMPRQVLVTMHLVTAATMELFEITLPTVVDAWREWTPGGSRLE